MCCRCGNRCSVCGSCSSSRVSLDIVDLVANVIIVALWLVVLGKVTVVVEDKKKAKRAIPKSVKT